MARRNSEATASTEAEAPTTEPTEAAETTEAPAKEVTPVDIESFKGVVTEVLGDADTSTGELSVEALAKTTEAYRELDGLKNKNAARDFIEESMRSAIMEDDGPKAKSFVLIRKSLSAGTAKKESKPKDPTEAFVSKVAQLVAAQTIVTETVPEGVAEGWVEQVNEMQAKLVDEARSLINVEEGAEAPEVSADARKVVKLASGKAAGGASGATYSGPRRNVGVHIANAFAELNSGDFLTVNEIAKKKSDEYGDDEPSSGAISARLFPASGKLNLPEGIVPVPADDSPDGKSRGARKA